jgi:hypothetical protein
LIITDTKPARKGASVTEDLRDSRHKGEFGAAVRQEKYKDTEELSRRKRAEMFNSANRSKDSKARSAGKRKVGNGWAEEEEEVGSNGKEVHYSSGFEGKEIDMNNTDDSEEQGYTGNSRMYQGQQLDDMDKFDRDEVKEDAHKYQGQQLDDMDRFDRDEVKEDAHRYQGQLLNDLDKFKNRQVTEDINGHMYVDDAVPKFVEEMSRNRRYQMVGKNHPESQAEGSSLMSEDHTREHLQDGKKESRKSGYRGENGKEKEDEGQEDYDKLGRSIGDPLGSEDRVQPANATPEAPKGSIRAAIEQEMEKRNGVFTREARDTLRRSLGETNSNPASSHVKNNSEKIFLEKTAEAGIPPLRGFKEFFDNMKVSHDNDDEPVDKNGVQKDVKSEDAVMLGNGSSQARRLPRDMQTTGEDVVVDSLNLLNVKENKVNVKQSSGSAQETAEINNLDPMKLNALTTEERTSTNTRFDHVVNPKLNVEVSKVQEYSESADELQTDKQLIKEDHLDNVEVIRNKGKKDIESRNSDEGDSVVLENEELESRKTNENDSAVEENEDNDHDNLIQWGFYPTLSKTLKFSKFLAAFFKQERCSLRIFMAWTTAPWAYTPRHQRAIESILHFHPQACIVVFTETIDFKFFDSWVQEGYELFTCYISWQSCWGQSVTLFCTICCLTCDMRFSLVCLYCPI